MKFLFVLFFPFLFISNFQWHNNLDEAKQIAAKEHKYILLNFSGSDWCGPCIRMHNEIFGSDVFKKLADEQLVMVNADFPRKKKNQLSAAQQEINNKMADQYNPEGKFPLTVLLDENGKVLKDWDGFPNESAESFAIEVRNIIYINK